MSMPTNLVLIRHGQSEANIMQSAAKRGNNSYYTEEAMTIPDRSWRISPHGVAQAEKAGEWVRINIPLFNRFIVSPYIRTRETAAHLGISNAQWEENRVIRERSWGEIDSISRDDFKSRYPLNYIYKKKDPLYWSPPGGESIANVAENRVRNLLNTLHRENSEENVVLVTHGEFIWATRTVLERWSDENFVDYDADPEYKVHNCMIVHYTRQNPYDKSDLSHKIKWVRTAYPVFLEDGSYDMYVSEWKEVGRKFLSNEDLLRVAESQEYYIRDFS